MRKFLMILGGIAAFAVVAVMFVFWLTSGMTGVASDFMAKIRAGDNNGAYKLTSQGFRKNVNFSQFDTYVKRRQFETLGEPSWSNRSINGAGDSAIGKVKGSVKLPAGGSQPIEITLTKNDGKWVVHHLEIRTGGLKNANAASNRKPPAEAELIKLVSDTNAVFSRAIEKKDMKILHDYISAFWRKQVTVEGLDKIFGEFMRRDATLGGLRNLTPAFNGPARIDENGIMRISGSYETRPFRTLFRHSYMYEGLGWKLFGINVTMQRVKNTGDTSGKPANTARPANPASPASPAPAESAAPARSP